MDASSAIIGEDLAITEEGNNVGLNYCRGNRAVEKEEFGIIKKEIVPTDLSGAQKAQNGYQLCGWGKMREGESLLEEDDEFWLKQHPRAETLPLSYQWWKLRAAQ